MSQRADDGRHRRAQGEDLTRPRGWAVSYRRGYPGWLLYSVICAETACAALWRPGDWWSWVVTVVGLICLASAVAFRSELRCVNEWGTGERVPVTFGRYLWLQAFKLPLLAMITAAIVYAVWTHMPH